MQKNTATSIGLITIKSNECDRNYLYWLMRTHYYQRSIANTATGSTVHHTSPSKIYDFEFLRRKIKTTI